MPPSTASSASQTASWLARLHHDLVKRLLWPARDRRDLGGPVREGELVVTLVDDDGAPCSAADSWRRFEAEAPATCDTAAKEAFARAVHRAVDAAAHDDLDGVLALATAYEQLAQNVKSRA